MQGCGQFMINLCFFLSFLPLEGELEGVIRNVGKGSHCTDTSVHAVP